MFTILLLRYSSVCLLFDDHLDVEGVGATIVVTVDKPKSSLEIPVFTNQIQIGIFVYVDPGMGIALWRC